MTQSIRNFEKSLELYKAEHGAYPAVPANNAFPAEIADDFHGDQAVSFEQFGGGVWKYMLKADGCAMICLVFRSAPDTAKLQELDTQIDDGDLTTDHFSQFSSKRFDYCLK